MHCEKFEARLQDLLDRRECPQLDAQLVEHADACEPCRETLLVQEQLFAGLDLWEAPPAPEGFATRVVAQHLRQHAIATAAPAAANGGLAIKLLAGALAASLLLTVIGFAVRQNRGAPDAVPAPEVVQQDAVEPPTNAPITVESPTETKVVQSPQLPGPEPEIAVDQQLLNQHPAMQFVSSAPELLDGHATGRMIREVTTSLPEVKVVEETIPGLRPITSSFGMTIGMVRRTLPGGSDSSPREAPKQQPPVKPQAEVVRDDGQLYA